MRAVEFDADLSVRGASVLALLPYSDEAASDGRWAADLTFSEAACAARIRSATRRAAWLAGRLAAKAAVCRLTSRPPARVEVLPAPSGAPVVTLLDRVQERVEVSIAHTRGLAAAVAHRRCETGAMGVDVEAVDQVIDPALIWFAFVAEEACAIAHLGPLARHRRTLEFWTAKEAVLKALLCGLSVPLTDVRLEPDPVPGRLRARVGRGAAGCAEFDVLLTAGPDHVLAVAVEHERRR